MRIRLGLAAAGLVFLAAQGVLAAEEHDHATQACPTDGSALTPELANWAARTPAEAGKRADRLDKASLQLGQAVDAALSPTPDVKYVVRPEKPGGSVSYGGLFGFDIAEAGTYRVALGSGAWIDVLQGETVIASVAHGHGPECSGVRKMVDFPLQPGRYTLQIAANGKAELPVLVTRLP